MFMWSVAVNGGHLLGAVAGFGVILACARWRPAPPGTLWIVTALCSALMAAALFGVTEPHDAWADFRKVYWQVAVALTDGGPQAIAYLYDPGPPIKFVNLPIVAYLFAPLAWIRFVGSGEWGAAEAFTALGVLAMLGVWLLLVRLYRLDRTESAVVLFALAAFGPLVYSFRQGNTSHLLLLPILLGVLLLRKDRRLAAGALFGLAAVLKPPLVILGLYFAARGRWRVAWGGLAVAAAAFALSALIFGGDMLVLWWRNGIEPFLGRPIPGAHSVETIQSFVLRFSLPADGMHGWNPTPLGPVGKAVSYALIAAILGAAGWMLAKAPRLRDPSAADVEAELLALLVAICFLSTSSWGHYYVWAIPGFVWAMTETRRGAAGEPLRPLLIGCFVLAAPGVFASDAMRAGAFGPATNWLNSHLLFAGVGLALLLVRLRALAPGGVAAAPAEPAVPAGAPQPAPRR